jgi:hypothetical protein
MESLIHRSSQPTLVRDNKSLEDQAKWRLFLNSITYLLSLRSLRSLMLGILICWLPSLHSNFSTHELIFSVMFLLFLLVLKTATSLNPDCLVRILT